MWGTTTLQLTVCVCVCILHVCEPYVFFSACAKLLVAHPPVLSIRSTHTGDLDLNRGDCERLLVGHADLVQVFHHTNTIYLSLILRVRVCCFARHRLLSRCYVLHH